MNLYTLNNKSLKFEKIPMPTMVAILIAVCCFSIGVGLFITKNKQETKPKNAALSSFTLEDLESNEKVIVLNNCDEFSEEKLVQMLLDLNVKFPDIAFAQARYESGNWGTNPGANIFHANNNLFGMKIATQRPTTNVGLENNHALYDTWRMSVMDYALWQSNMTIGINTREDYMAFLKRRYAEGSYVSIEQITRATQKKYPQLFVKRHPALEKVKLIQE